MSQSDKDGVKAIEALPPVGAYLCETTETYAKYWLKGARETSDPAEKVMFAEQAVNGWKNLAYDLARQAHYYQKSQRGEHTPSSSTRTIVVLNAVDFENTLRDWEKHDRPIDSAWAAAVFRGYGAAPSATEAFAWPQPAEEDRRSGWLICPKFLQRVEEEMSANYGYQASLEQIETVLRVVRDVPALFNRADDTGAKRG